MMELSLLNIGFSLPVVGPGTGMGNVSAGGGTWTGWPSGCSSKAVEMAKVDTAKGRSCL
jgi:hypothetical protein